VTDVPRLDGYWLHEREFDSREALLSAFEWTVPERFNMAAHLVDRPAAEHPDRPAVYAEEAGGRQRTVSFGELYDQAAALAGHLAAAGVERGDRVGVNAPQKPETLVAHLACWKLGAVSVPLSVLFGEEGVRYRLDDAGAVACVVDEANVDTLRAVRERLEPLEVLTVDVEPTREDETDLHDALAAADPVRDTADTAADETAMIIYTSGTTGAPKGVVHGHELLLGQLPHFVCSFCNLQLDTGEDGDVFYAPIEWSWVAVFNFVVPALFFGRPVVAYAGGPFDPEATLGLLERYGVTCFGAPPTALRAMKAADTAAYDLDSVRVVEAGGEALGEDVAGWARETFGAVVHEHYGQTEADVVVGDCTAVAERRPGCMGMELPGHEVAVLDPDSLTPVEPGEVGELAVRYEGDPVCFQEYWNKPEKTAATLREGWLLTDDLATVDADGYFSFRGRRDDVIIRSGYRIGPEELESTLATHEAVADAGVVGVADERRGEVPKAFVVLAGDRDPYPELADELRAHARQRLAEYEYPAEVEFVTSLPTTVTGKVKRSALRERENR